MSFNNNVPLGTDLIRDTTDPIRTNFFELDARLQNDHASINDADALKRLTHDKVRFNLQGADPTTSATQTALYGKNVSTNGTNYQELFFRRPNNGSTIQMTTGNLDPNKTINDGYTFLPGGLVYMWGLKSAAGVGFINDADQNLPQVNGINVAKIYSLNLQIAFTTKPLLTGAFIVLIQNINNGVSPATFRPRYLQANGDDAFSKPTYYQAIVELVS